MSLSITSISLRATLSWLLKEHVVILLPLEKKRMFRKSINLRLYSLEEKIILYCPSTPAPPVQRMTLKPCWQWRLQPRGGRAEGGTHLGGVPCVRKSGNTRGKAHLDITEYMESKATQNSMKLILAEIIPHLSHTIIFPLLNKMPSYFHQIGIWPIQEQTWKSP